MKIIMPIATIIVWVFVGYGFYTLHQEFAKENKIRVAKNIELRKEIETLSQIKIERIAEGGYKRCPYVVGTSNGKSYKVFFDEELPLVGEIWSVTQSKLNDDCKTCEPILLLKSKIK